ncbi:MAG: efflux RND transporter periplasmic adaptor subunit [Candidatus Eisenbacteria bacterium]|nr:efflux RND transporter periplasmic adaptor subunit [Candidatus Eisenbacteria bacterium]
MNDESRIASPGASPADSHTPPPGARSMNILRWVLFAGLLLLAAVSVGGYLLARRGGPHGAGVAAHARYYCPMHPSYTSDRPGECPICGMTLEPIPAGGVPSADSAMTGDVPGLSTVQLTPERVQMIGVRTARVARRVLGGDLELAAEVAPDEGSLRRVTVRVSGQVQQLMVNHVGQRVAVGDPLLSIYSPEVLQTEQELLIERGAGDTVAVDEHGMGGPSVARERLRLLGVPVAEIRRLELERVASPVVTFNSRYAGVVLERFVTEGQQIGPDTPLFTIADLGRVWVLADVYEMDAARVRTGDRATFVPDAMGGAARSGAIEFVYPTVSGETRTLKVRLALDNPGGALKPGMYGRVRIAGRGGPALVVPGEAVIETGERRYVFLAHAGGRFEPRTVTTGARGDGMVQVLSGVAEGDTVAASAAFLIDSESRLKAAISGMGGGSAMPGMPGMAPSSAPAPRGGR